MKKWVLIVSLFTPAMAWAHAGHATAGGFPGGIAHPFSGADHLLAMLAVGVWASQRGGRALWAWPVAFVTLMSVGSLSALSGLTFLYIEQGIATSLLVFGLLIAASIRLPLLAGVWIVGVFALFHGAAHGLEMPAGNPLLYIAGFALSTAALHATGIGAGLLGRGVWTRLAGAAVGASGLYLMLA